MSRATFLDNILNRPSQKYAPGDAGGKAKSRSYSVGAYPTDLPNAPQGPQSILSGSMFSGSHLTQASNPGGSKYNTVSPSRPGSVAGWSTTSSIFGRKKKDKKNRSSVIDVFSDAGSTVMGDDPLGDGAGGYKQRKTRWWESGSKFRGGTGRKGPPSVAESTVTEPAWGGYNARTDKRLSAAGPPSSTSGAKATKPSYSSSRAPSYDPTIGISSPPRRTAMSDYGGPTASSHRRASSRSGAMSPVPPLPAHDPAALKAMSGKASRSTSNVTLGAGVAPLGQQGKNLLTGSKLTSSNGNLRSSASITGGLPASTSITSLHTGSSAAANRGPRRASSALGHYSSAQSDVGGGSRSARSHARGGSQDWHEFVAEMNNKEISKTWATADAANPVVRRNTAAQRVAKELQSDAEAATAAMIQRNKALAGSGRESPLPTSLAQAAEQIIGQSLPVNHLAENAPHQPADQIWTLPQQGITILPPGIEPGSLIITDAHLQQQLTTSRPTSPVAGGRPMSPLQRAMSPLGRQSAVNGRETPATLNSVGADEYATASEASDNEADPASEAAPAIDAATTAAASNRPDHNIVVVEGASSTDSSEEEEEEDEDDEVGLANPLDPLAEEDEDNSSAGHSSVARMTGVYRHHEMRARPKPGYTGLSPALHVHALSSNANRLSGSFSPSSPTAPLPQQNGNDDAAPTELSAKAKGKARAVDAEPLPATPATQLKPNGILAAPVNVVNPNLPSPQANRKVPAPPPPPRNPGGVVSTSELPDVSVSSEGLSSVPPTPPEKDTPVFAVPSTEVDDSSEDGEAQEGEEDSSDSAESEDETDEGADSDASESTVDNNKTDAASALIAARQRLQASSSAPRSVRDIELDENLSVQGKNTVSFDDSSERESLASSSKKSLKPPTIQRRLSDLSLGNSFRMSVIMRAGDTGNRSIAPSQRAASSLRIKLGADDSDSDGEANVSDDDDDLKRRAQAEQDRLRNMKVGEDFFGPDLSSLLDKFDTTDWNAAATAAIEEKAESNDVIDKYGLTPGTRRTKDGGSDWPIPRTADERAALDAQDRINDIRRSRLEQKDQDQAIEVASVVPSIAALWLMNQEASTAEPVPSIPAAFAPSKPTGVTASESKDSVATVSPARPKSKFGSLFSSPHDKSLTKFDSAVDSPKRTSSILDRPRFRRVAQNDAAEQATTLPKSGTAGHARNASVTSNSSSGTAVIEDEVLRNALAQTASFYNTAPNTKAEVSAPVDSKETEKTAAPAIPSGPTSSATAFLTPASTLGTLSKDSTLSNNLLSSSDSAPSALGKTTTGSTDTKKSIPKSSSSSAKPLTSAMKKTSSKPTSLADSLVSFPLSKRSSSLSPNVKSATFEAGVGRADDDSDGDDEIEPVATAPMVEKATAPPSAWAARQAKVAKSERKAERLSKAKAAEEIAKAQAEALATAKALRKSKKSKGKSKQVNEVVTPEVKVQAPAAPSVPAPAPVPAPPKVEVSAAKPSVVETATKTEPPSPKVVVASEPTESTESSQELADDDDDADSSSDESFVSVDNSPTISKPAESLSAPSEANVVVSIATPAPVTGSAQHITVTVTPEAEPAAPAAGAAAQSLLSVDSPLQSVPEYGRPLVIPASVASGSPGEATDSTSPPLSDMWSEQSAVSTNITSPGPADSIVSKRDLSPGLKYVTDAIESEARARAEPVVSAGAPLSKANLSAASNWTEKKLPLPPAPDFSETTQVPLEDRTPLARPRPVVPVGVNLIPPTPPAQDLPGSPLSPAFKLAVPEPVPESAEPQAIMMERSTSSQSGGAAPVGNGAAAVVALPGGMVVQTVAKSGQKKVRSAKIPGLEGSSATAPGPKHPNVPRSLVPLPPELGANIPLEPGLASLTLPPTTDGSSSVGSDSPNASPAPSQSGRSSVASSAISRASRTSSSLRYQAAMNQVGMRTSPGSSERRPSMAAIEEWESSASPYGAGLPGPLSPYPPLPASALTRSSLSLSQGSSPSVVRQAPLGAPASHYLPSQSPSPRDAVSELQANAILPPSESTSPVNAPSIAGSSYAPSATQSAVSLPLTSAPSVYRPVKDPSKLSSKVDEALYGRTTMLTISITSGSPRQKSNRRLASTTGHGTTRDDASIRSSGEITSNLRDELAHTTMALSAHMPPPRKVGSAQVLVQIIAVAIDEMDRLIVQDRIRQGKGFGFVPGRSFCGRIMECGWDVKRFRKGDIVFGMQDGAKCGALAEFMAIDSVYVCKAPEDCLTTEQISALPAAGLLSYEIVATYCNQLERGSRVLILNAHDGVGLLVMQQSIELGLIIVAQCPTAIADGVTVCRANGAHEVVVGEPLWAINSLHESSFDLVVDTVGGRRIYDASRRILATNGQFATCFGDQHDAASPNLKSHMRSLRRAFFKKDKKNIGYEWVGNITVEDCKEALESVKAAAERGDICPRLSSILPFEDATRAFDPVLRGVDQEPGAVVVRVS
ncbi:hypothetical protein OC846_003709 [Tilletia horrida]|uniref:Enoyl reductase (ER) domain-containing protein n=1 Tax=Tilletia horrida TaxID=155126 RepID=A0AAN6GPJ7_9BASI|nr:hypothetical protein OC846_003709 [Tilletia horrida]KAK0565457.1 hypothetical protein OC861_003755 [Tilletia horrida]